MKGADVKSKFSSIIPEVKREYIKLMRILI